MCRRHTWLEVSNRVAYLHHALGDQAPPRPAVSRGAKPVRRGLAFASPLDGLPVPHWLFVAPWPGHSNVEAISLQPDAFW